MREAKIGIDSDMNLPERHFNFPDRPRSYVDSKKVYDFQFLMGDLPINDGSSRFWEIEVGEPFPELLLCGISNGHFPLTKDRAATCWTCSIDFVFNWDHMVVRCGCQRMVRGPIRRIPSQRPLKLGLLFDGGRCQIYINGILSSQRFEGFKQIEAGERLFPFIAINPPPATPAVQCVRQLIQPMVPKLSVLAADSTIRQLASFDDISALTGLSPRIKDQLSRIYF